MGKKSLGLALLSTVAAITLALPASAQDASTDLLAKERFQLRVRAINVSPDEESNVNIGGHVDAKSFVTPEVDVTYFLTPKLGLELIAATSRHELDYSVNGANLGEAWILPPTLTLTYHPFRGESAFSPYVGAGLNYSMFYGESSGTGFNDLELDGGLGYALQAGADYWIDDHWGLNVDVKRIWLDVDANLRTGATPIHADVDLDPWVVGAGISYKF